MIYLILINIIMTLYMLFKIRELFFFINYSETENKEVMDFIEKSKEIYIGKPNLVDECIYKGMSDEEIANAKRAYDFEQGVEYPNE